MILFLHYEMGVNNNKKEIEKSNLHSSQVVLPYNLEHYLFVSEILDAHVFLYFEVHVFLIHL